MHTYPALYTTYPHPALGAYIWGMAIDFDLKILVLDLTEIFRSGWHWQIDSGLVGSLGVSFGVYNEGGTITRRKIISETKFINHAK